MSLAAPNIQELLTKTLHSDAENTQYAFDWRLEQETALRASKGTGMTDEQVVKFVDGCTCALERSLKMATIPFITNETAVNPGYELYSDTVRKGVFESNGGQLRLIVGKDRRVKQIIRL
jgi:D-glycerate 3-kinase